MEDCLKEIAEYEILDWSHDRFRIMTMIGTQLKDIPNLDYRLRLGNLAIGNLSFYDEETIDLLEKFQTIIETTAFPTELQFNDVICKLTGNHNGATAQLSFNERLENLQKELLEFQTEDTGIIFVRKDRGANLDYYQKFLFDVEALVTKATNDISWSINSYYKNWLLYEASGCSFYYLDHLLELVNEEMADLAPKLQDSHLECYGCIYSFFVFLEQNLLKVIEIDNRYEVLEKLFLCYSIYQKNHLGKDALKDSEIYANMGRVTRFYQYELATIIMNSGISNTIPQYLYMFFLEMASKTAPYQTGRKYDYHASAFMMHQNQTVEGVTEDAFEIPWEQVGLICGSYVNSVCRYVENKFISGIFYKCIEVKRKLFIKDLPENLKIHAKDIPLIASKAYRMRKPEEFIRYFDIYNQLENFKTKGYVKEPFKPFYFKAQDLIDNIGKDSIESIEQNESNRGAANTLWIKTKLANIFSLRIEVDENENIIDVLVYLTCMPDESYKMLSQLKKERVFYGIPFYPMQLMDVMALSAKLILRPLFRNEYDFGFNILK